MSHIFGQAPSIKAKSETFFPGTNTLAYLTFFMDLITWSSLVSLWFCSVSWPIRVCRSRSLVLDDCSASYNRPIRITISIAKLSIMDLSINATQLKKQILMCVLQFLSYLLKYMSLKCCNFK
jgi:hypothetical protein